MNWYETLINTGLTPKVEADLHPHCEEEKAQLFQSFDAASTEIEYLSLIYALVRSVKPQCCIETGTFKGLGAIVIASALKENQQDGTLITIERDDSLCRQFEAVAEKRQLPNITVINEDSVSYCAKTAMSFDFAFFDSDIPCRYDEFMNLYRRGKLTNLAAFHDTSPNREKTFSYGYPHDRFLNNLDEIKKFASGCIEFPLSRGLTLFQLKDKP